MDGGRMSTRRSKAGRRSSNPDQEVPAPRPSQDARPSEDVPEATGEETEGEGGSWVMVDKTKGKKVITATDVEDFQPPAPKDTAASAPTWRKSVSKEVADFDLSPDSSLASTAEGKRGSHGMAMAQGSWRNSNPSPAPLPQQPAVNLAPTNPWAKPAPPPPPQPAPTPPPVEAPTAPSHEVKGWGDKAVLARSSVDLSAPNAEDVWQGPTRSPAKPTTPPALQPRTSRAKSNAEATPIPLPKPKPKFKSPEEPKQQPPTAAPREPTAPPPGSDMALPTPKPLPRKRSIPEASPVVSPASAGSASPNGSPSEFDKIFAAQESHARTSDTTGGCRTTEEREGVENAARQAAQAAVAEAKAAEEALRAASRQAAAAKAALEEAERATQRAVDEDAEKADPTSLAGQQADHTREGNSDDEANEDPQLHQRTTQNSSKAKKEAPKDKKKRKKKGNEKGGTQDGALKFDLDREQLVKSSFAVLMLIIWIYCGYSWVTSMLTDTEDVVDESIY